MNMKKLVILVVFFMAFANGFCQEVPLDKGITQTLAWENDPSVTAYHVIIQQGNTIILDKEVQDDHVTLVLQEGKYTFTLQVLNKFHKVEAQAVQNFKVVGK